MAAREEEENIRRDDTEEMEREADPDVDADADLASLLPTEDAVIVRTILCL